MSDHEFPRKQYEQAWKTLSDENSRFWTRFNISLVINTGLVIGFSTFLDSLKDSGFLGVLGAICISVMGIFFSILWLNITEIALKYTDHYFKVVRKIEDDEEFKKEMKDDFKILPQKDKIKGSITKTSLWYPKAFLIFWAFLTLIFVLVLMYPSMIDFVVF